MDLQTLVRAAWRHKWIMLFSLMVGSWMAFNALYESVFNPARGASELRARSYTTYRSTARLVLDEPQFGLGKLAMQQGEPNGLPRTLILAKTYSYMIASEDVMKRLHKRYPKLSASFEAVNVEQAPIIEIVATSRNKEQAQDMADAVGAIFVDYIRDKQEANGIPAMDRVTISQLGPASAPVATRSRRLEIGLLALAAPLIAGLLLALAAENVRAGGAKKPSLVTPVESAESTKMLAVDSLDGGSMPRARAKRDA